MPRTPPPKSGDPLEELVERGPRTVYAVDGEERLLVDEAVKKLKEHSLPRSARDFNFDQLSARSAGATRIVEAAQMLPAFAPRRLVLVQHAELLDTDDGEEAEGEAAKKRREKKGQELKILLDYLERPCPTTVLVLVAEKFDARTKLYKALQRAGVTLRFARPKPKEVPDLIRRRARSTGVAIEDPAIRALADSVGADTTAAFQALELLSLYVGPDAKRAITAADVETLISETREESIFALADAIGKQDRASALKGLHGMLSISREHPLRILAMIARHWRNLARARSLLDAGMPRDELGAAVGIPPFLVDGLLGQARRQPVTAFVRGLEAIAATDRELKGGPLNNLRAMERLVLNLMSGS